MYDHEAHSASRSASDSTAGSSAQTSTGSRALPNRPVRPLVLGSTSRHRRALLERLRLPIICAAPSFVERSVDQITSAAEAHDLVLHNARGKLESLRKPFPAHLVLTSDQVGECEGRVLGKAVTVERAVEQLEFLSGRDHRLFTSVILADTETGRSREAVVVNSLRMRALSIAQIRSYVEAERPLDAAGSYYSEGLGIALFEYLRGDDPTAIVGLPLITVTGLLEDFSCFPLDPGP